MNRILWILLIPALPVLLASTSVPAGAAEAQNSAFWHPDVVAAAVMIDMSPEQTSEFRRIVGEFGASLQPAFDKLVRQRNGYVDIERRWRQKRGQLVRKMDTEMAGVLSEAQYPGYENYVRVLLETMDEMAAERRRRR